MTDVVSLPDSFLFYGEMPYFSFSIEDL